MKRAFFSYPKIVDKKWNSKNRRVIECFEWFLLKEMSASSGAYSRLMALKDMGVVEVAVRIRSYS